MPRAAPGSDDADLASPKRPWTRESFAAALQRRYSPRLHMSLILAASGLAAMLGSATLLHAGVGSMLVRYPIAISLAYATFLLGVWTWLRAMGLLRPEARAGRGLRDSGGIELPGGSGSSGGGGGGGGGLRIGAPRGGGGTFDGGGASSSFAENPATPAAFVDAKGGGAKANVLSGALDGVDGDGLVLLLLAIALVAGIFLTSGYLVYCAPDVLTEAAFGAALAGSLTRSAKREGPAGWIGGVVRKTWWPYAIVLVLALAFAGFAARHYPQATTFRQALSAALS